MNNQNAVNDTQRVNDINAFYVILDKLHSLAFKNNDVELVDAIAREKLSLIKLRETLGG